MDVEWGRVLSRKTADIPSGTTVTYSVSVSGTATGNKTSAGSALSLATPDLQLKNNVASVVSN